MAQSSLMELSTRVERAALALRAATQAPTAPRLAVVMEDLGHTCRHLARAVDRWVGWAEQSEAASAVTVGDESASDGMRQFANDLKRCEGTAAAARDALLDLGRNT
jgi:hypothetical protein